MSLFSWLRGKDDISEMKRFVDTIAELNECQVQNGLLHRALWEACAELYKYTGKIEHQPEYFIEKVKNRYGYAKEVANDEI